MRIVISLALAALTLAAQSKPKYEIYAIQYATLKDFPVRGLLAGADPSRKMDVAMTVWLIKGGGSNILLDSGFYRDKFMNQYKPAGYSKPSEAVARAGVKPEEITDVIISHIHWDHADGADLFPKAKVHIQREEFQYYADWVDKGGKGGSGDPLDIAMLRSIQSDGRLDLIDGDNKEILPGITVYTGGKHTYASQYAGVNTAAGIVVLASDNMYLYENLDKHVAIAQTLDAASNLRAQDRMRQLAANPKLIIPGHDPAVFQRFPEVAPGVVKIE